MKVNNVMHVARYKYIDLDAHAVTIQAPESGGQVDWCSPFPGIEQPNEAYAPVLKRNIAYEQTKKPLETEDRWLTSPGNNRGRV